MRILSWRLQGGAGVEERTGVVSVVKGPQVDLRMDLWTLPGRRGWDGLRAALTDTHHHEQKK